MRVFLGLVHFNLWRQLSFWLCDVVVKEGDALFKKSEISSYNYVYVFCDIKFHVWRQTSNLLSLMTLLHKPNNTFYAKC